MTKQAAEASMTVHSKEAYKMIYGMFNETLCTAADEGERPPNEDTEFEKQFALTSCEYFM